MYQVESHANAFHAGCHQSEVLPSVGFPLSLLLWPGLLVQKGMDLLLRIRLPWSDYESPWRVETRRQVGSLSFSCIYSLAFWGVFALTLLAVLL